MTFAVSMCGFPAAVDPVYARRIADRTGGVGCDQVIVIEPSERADAFMRISIRTGRMVMPAAMARAASRRSWLWNMRNDVSIETARGYCAHYARVRRGYDRYGGRRGSAGRTSARACLQRHGDAGRQLDGGEAGRSAHPVR